MLTDKETKELGALEIEVAEECKKIIKEKRYPVYSMKFNAKLFSIIPSALLKTTGICLLSIIFLLLIQQFSLELILNDFYIIGVVFIVMLVLDIASLNDEMEIKTCKPVFEEAIRRVIERSHASKAAKQQLIDDARVPPRSIFGGRGLFFPWRRAPFSLYLNLFKE